MIRTRHHWATRTALVEFIVRALGRLDMGAHVAIVATMSGMVAVVSMQVLLRYVFNDSLDWGEDVARLLFVWSIFLAIPLGIKSGAHVSIELLVRSLPAAHQRWLTRATAVLSIVLMTVVFYQAAILVIDQWDENLPALNVSVSLFMVPVCIGAAHSVLHLLRLAATGIAAASMGSAE